MKKEIYFLSRATLIGMFLEQEAEENDNNIDRKKIKSTLSHKGLRIEVSK